ncbi:hypothetical protein C7974DRAFT_373438 [Boeremia exigua]|uniref:uncharacterized protein n=1 Tax=Boeremia exigua TaxID=749465 RepID=UPI001E8CF316|nr:uncharacterized protein C7974DRAFT_373438 [Boeremia exigua]KAH6639169.1 hypothetical protein C7974DRAFT_373438 [Boeremia exigua]
MSNSSGSIVPYIAPPPPGSPFLALPAEIRNMIYAYLFREGESSVTLLARHRGGYIAMSDSLSMVATCRQIYREATSFMLRSRQPRLRITQPQTVLSLMLQNVQIEHSVMDAMMRQQPRNISVTYDLDSHSMVSNIPPLWHASSDLRKYMARRMEGDITVNTSITDEFRALASWAQSGRGGFADTLLPYWETMIRMRFPSEHAQFDAIKFVIATASLSADTILTSCVVGEENHSRGHMLFLTDVRSQLLLFVHKLLQRPDKGALTPCPVIWMSIYRLLEHADFLIQDQGIESIPFVQGDEFVSGYSFVDEYTVPHLVDGRLDLENTLLGLAVRLAVIMRDEP